MFLVLVPHTRAPAAPVREDADAPATLAAIQQEARRLIAVAPNSAVVQQALQRGTDGHPQGMPPAPAAHLAP